ncbi:MAG: Rne/Rng family ribonuclease [Pelagibacteraceae bacterium]|jgi:ribonuclease E|nr:Rne/Rng family ribonuclease [Pelagibacteraceae bacterium]HJO13648.1 Rne/Rng family ribonuclease [Alphaproteobacteria bacterium]MBO6465955.1 Rne/Rng family ribonuclease [Pelagibacteraceae bacterium]MBO6470360.1 Rne/Rng family ribonuclease [Pelagibacteraceae bacterium]MBO6471424.1 Rne/Rng family ribonuclease [Pelagibacteraceae bacterium]
MSKKILIDTTSNEEIRVAITENGKLDDFEIESKKKNALKGNIYLAKITRIEPSLQAAFVDYGADRHGFLPLTEIHPDYFKIPTSDQENFQKLSSNLQFDENIDEIISKGKKDQIPNNEDLIDDDGNNNKNRKRDYLSFFKKYKIQEVIKSRQVILAQINKEERGLKGAALTTFLSFAGRYCVLMPNSLTNNGISRKIADYEERKKLKSILTDIKIPEKMSVIIRTAGVDKTKKEISKDLTFLTTQWNKIREKTLKSAAPIIIHEEGSIIKRTIRDMLTNDVAEVYVEGKVGYENAKKFTKILIPKKEKDIKLYKDKNKTLFNENNIEHQISDLFSLKVNLESGGSLVINTTEALVAIDVNSGRDTSERNIESTALKTNLEAANEIARQFRLRDLGGLVVIDFIDMDDYRNNFKVEKAIKTALYRDRARVQIGRISMFGLLELSRQRLRSSMIEKSFDKCHYCNGSGIISNINLISEQIIKVIQEKLLISKSAKVLVKCNSALAQTLINIKREEINKLEEIHNANIEFSFDNHFSLHEPLIETGKVDKKNTKKDISKKSKKIIKNGNTRKKQKKETRKKKKIVKKSDKIMIKKNKIEVNETVIVNENSDKNLEKTGWWSK